MLTSEELTRYSRHLILPQVGMDGQIKLKNASVLIVGCGGLGAPVAMYLAAAGVGRIGLLDGDAVESSNLQRQIIHFADDIGSPKAISAANKLRKINSHIEIEAIVENLTIQNAEHHIGRYDMVIDCTDNFPTRYLINDTAVRVGNPIIFGSVFRFEGQVSTFGFGDGPCYRCVFPKRPSDSESLSCAEGGVLGVLPGIIGCWLIVMSTVRHVVCTRCQLIAVNMCISAVPASLVSKGSHL